MTRRGRLRLFGAALSALTNLLFAWLTTRGHDLPALIAVISADNLSAGIASAAFVAYLSSLTNVAYSATQYAVFSSLMLLLPKFLAGWSGWVVDTYGYPAFFIATTCVGAPTLERCSRNSASFAAYGRFPMNRRTDTAPSCERRSHRAGGPRRSRQRCPSK